MVEEIWNKTLGLGDLPRRARSERCFWAAFLAERMDLMASHRAGATLAGATLAENGNVRLPTENEIRKGTSLADENYHQ